MRNIILSLFVSLTLSLVTITGAMASEVVRVLMATDAGDILLELYPERAPATVENFLRYVDGGYYSGGEFYRVVRQDNQAQNNIRIEVIQGGRGMDVETEVFPPVVHETTKSSGLLHKDGVISMGRFKPGSATSEFFICIGDQPSLDYGGMRNPDGQGFAAFGKVITGMDIVRRVQKMPTIQPMGDELEYTSGQMLVKPVAIQSVTRINAP
ncbi:peptidylprolyl isomerase [Emcibacter sp.]|uniref:peptidylprolyl isomerase n=1 Tax=Emcibacter sp. TaxID=1979954 RepID=UPI003A93B8E2